MLSDNAPLLSLNGLSACIGRQTVLEDVGFTLSNGQCLAVVGGSGAGKSTLLRLILGLRKPAVPVAGHLCFDGHDYALSKASSGKPMGIAYVPQSPAHGFDPLRRLRWQWQQLQRLLGKHAAGGEVLDALGLPVLAKAFPHEWSRGMQQRLLVAMALLEQPKMLILDEPTSALDPLIAAQVLTEVQRVAQECDIAVMMVTHDLALAAQFADQIAILHQGHMVQTGPAQQVLTAPSCDYAAELVAHRYWQQENPESLAAE
ncbi:ATP-binding cassette domain-containing protein [Parasedimentitalea maritima]|uniref:ATP-binding cassette domain-containing protein n=1 Tax=Parasedimentitalea maritima TaxID=2578117 RepID=UPI001FE68ACF|nr:ATP-binding cassette domain-containing protein [Zongyanglinia marina]